MKLIQPKLTSRYNYRRNVASYAFVILISFELFFYDTPNEKSGPTHTLSLSFFFLSFVVLIVPGDDGIEYRVLRVIHIVRTCPSHCLDCNVTCPLPPKWNSNLFFLMPCALSIFQRQKQQFCFRLAWFPKFPLFFTTRYLW